MPSIRHLVNRLIIQMVKLITTTWQLRTNYSLIALLNIWQYSDDNQFIQRSRFVHTRNGTEEGKNIEREEEGLFTSLRWKILLCLVLRSVKRIDPMAQKKPSPNNSKNQKNEWIFRNEVFAVISITLCLYCILCTLNFLLVFNSILYVIFKVIYVATFILMAYRFHEVFFRCDTI